MDRDPGANKGRDGRDKAIVPSGASLGPSRLETGARKGRAGTDAGGFDGFNSIRSVRSPAHGGTRARVHVAPADGSAESESRVGSGKMHTLQADGAAAETRQHSGAADMAEQHSADEASRVAANRETQTFRHGVSARELTCAQSEGAEHSFLRRQEEFTRLMEWNLQLFSPHPSPSKLRVSAGLRRSQLRRMQSSEDGAAACGRDRGNVDARMDAAGKGFLERVEVWKEQKRALLKSLTQRYNDGHVCALLCVRKTMCSCTYLCAHARIRYVGVGVGVGVIIFDAAVLLTTESIPMLSDGA